MAFDWTTFLNRYRVPFNTRGPNTPANAVTIRCPLCGAADHSDHMVLWPGGGWRCWRNHEHGGQRPARLIQVMLGCSFAEAQRLAGNTPIPTAADFNAIATMFTPSPVAATVAQRVLKLPPEFRLFGNRWSCKPFMEYLSGRGFAVNPSALEHMGRAYELHFATRGPFKGRIIFPIRYQGQIISWTGRTIYAAEPTRYKALTTNAEAAERVGLEPALAPANHHLLWWDWLRRLPSHTELVLVEGPLDALRINMLSRRSRPVAATCWLGSEPTIQQRDLLHQLARGFKRCWIIPDADMKYKAYRIADAMRPQLFTVAMLPHRVEDPAELRSYPQLLETLR